LENLKNCNVGRCGEYYLLNQGGQTGRKNPLKGSGGKNRSDFVSDLTLDRGGKAFFKGGGDQKGRGKARGEQKGGKRGGEQTGPLRNES